MKQPALTRIYFSYNPPFPLACQSIDFFALISDDPGLAAWAEYGGRSAADHSGLGISPH